MISVVINTCNEEKYLEKAILSVEGFADEVVVIDMESIDESVLIAKKMGAIVYQHKKEDYVELARNYGISKAKGNWILILDPDESVPTSLKSKLKGIASEEKYDFVRLPRKNLIFNKWVKNSRWWPDYNIRFFRKGSVVWSEIIHSVPETHGVGFDLDAIEENAISHNHYDSIEQYIARLNRYTSAQSENLYKSRYKFIWTDILTKPSNEFLSRYFFGLGYKDGLHGLALSLLQAFSELVVYLKVWEKNKFEQQNIPLSKSVSEIKKLERDFHYWIADSLYKQSPKLIYQIKRKFKLP